MPPMDTMLGSPVTLTSPAVGGEVVTPNDSVDLATITRAVYVGGAGDLRVVMFDNNELTFTAVPAGAILPIRCKRIVATGTTATAVLALH